VLFGLRGYSEAPDLLTPVLLSMRILHGIAAERTSVLGGRCTVSRIAAVIPMAEVVMMVNVAVKSVRSMDPGFRFVDTESNKNNHPCLSGVRSVFMPSLYLLYNNP
jgi:hypothetical protein